MLVKHAPLLSRADGLPMEFHLDRVYGAERRRLARLVETNGGALVDNPARHHHSVVLSEGKPRSKARRPFSDGRDTFSTKFLDDCQAKGLLLELSDYRLETESAFVRPGDVRDVLLGNLAWSELAPAGRAVAVDSSDDELLDQLNAPEPLGRAGTAFKGRTKFSGAQDEALVRFVAAQWRGGSSPATGRRFWELTAPLLPAVLAGHTPLSLWTRFVKRVVPRLAELKRQLPPAVVLEAARAAGVHLPLTEDERRQVAASEAAAAADGAEERSSSSAEEIIAADDAREDAAGNTAGNGEARPVARDSDSGSSLRTMPLSLRHRTLVDGAGRQPARAPSTGSDAETDMEEVEAARGRPPRRLRRRPPPAAGGGDAGVRLGPERNSGEGGTAESALLPERTGADEAGQHAAACWVAPVVSKDPNWSSDYESEGTVRPTEPRASPGPANARSLAGAGSGSPVSTRSRGAVSSRGPPDARSPVGADSPARAVSQSPVSARRATETRTSASSRNRSPPDTLSRSPSSSRTRSPSASRSRSPPDPLNRSPPNTRSRGQSGSRTRSPSEAWSRSPAAAGGAGAVCLPIPAWRLYTETEEDVLLERLLAEEGLAPLSGCALWRRIEREGCLPGRTWQSMRQHFLVSMRPRLRHSERLDSEQRDWLCRKAGRRRSAPRRPYLHREDVEILRFFEEVPRRVLLTRGRQVWQELERTRRLDRTWQSMKERFFRVIVPNCDRYKVVPRSFITSLQRHLRRSALEESD